MTDALDTLRPEVKEVLNRTDVTVEMFDTLVTVNRDDYDIIRAELLRLAVRNAELEAKATRDHEWVNDLLTENKKAEAELAALKTRIAEAPVVSKKVEGIAVGQDGVFIPHGHTVRLLVED